MKDMKTIFTICAMAALLLSACAKKEEKPEVTGYAKLLVDVANLPGTPALEVHYQGVNIGNAPIQQPGTRVEIGNDTKLSVYVKGTGQLVADTVLNLKKNQLSSYRVAYNKELGISGWISSKPVSADSNSVQFLNNLGPAFKAYAGYDLYLFYYDINTGDFVDLGIVIQDFQKVKLTPDAFSLAYYFEPGTPMFYLGRLKDKSTGQFIMMPSGVDYFVFEQTVEGATVIYNLADANGEVVASAIYL